MTFFYCILGFLTGVLSGMVGIGGGIFIVPALVFFAHMTQHKAQGTSLGALLAPIGVFAFWEYYKAGNVDIKATVIIACTFAVGGFFGGRFAQTLSEPALRRTFACFLIVVAARLLLQR